MGLQTEHFVALFALEILYLVVHSLNVEHQGLLVSKAPRTNFTDKFLCTFVCRFLVKFQGSFLTKTLSAFVAFEILDCCQ